MTQISIKQSREILELSQSQMATAMNVPLKTLQRWEMTGKITNPSAARLIKTMIWFHRKNRFSEYLSI